jgi:hypothetical protein
MKKLLIAAAFVLAACTPPAPQAVPDPEPSETARETFAATCTWGKVEGATLSIWSYDCGPDHRLVATDNGFTFPDGAVAIRAFTRAADAPIEAILADVRAASPGPHSDTCELVAKPDAEYAAREYYAFGPTGAAKAEWEAFIANPNGEGVDPPCGAMGPNFSGDRVFAVLPGHPEIVAFIEYGSEIQIFDVETLQVREAAP